MPSSPLIGRDAEMQWLVRVTGSAREGRGVAAVLRGDAGIGKSALLAALHERSAEFTVLSVAGVESENEIPFGTLQRLLLPRLAHADTLPENQRRALLVAIGMEQGDPADRTVVGLALLSLLAHLSETAPVLCVIDDAHWVDPESLAVIAFTARRVLAERVALVLAVRPETGAASTIQDLPTLVVTGLDREPSMDLLARTSRGTVDQRVADRVVSATGGNPLALIDLTRELSPHELAGRSVITEPIRLGRHLEEHYSRRASALPAETGRWLVLAAGEPGGDTGVIAAAARHLGIADDASREAELAGLVSVTDEVRFRHPLVRSAIYNGALHHDLRDSHLALAAVAEERGDRDGWVTHTAAATHGTDDELADQLEAAADRATRRGGYMTRTSLLLKSAGFSSSTQARIARTLDALESALAAGAATQAETIAASIDPRELDDAGRARLVAADADIAVLLIRDASFALRPAALLEAALLFQESSPARSRLTIAHAFWALFTAERSVRGTDATAIAEVARSLDDGSTDLPALGLRGIATLVLDGHAAAAPLIELAIEASSSSSDEGVLQSFTCIAYAAHLIRDNEGRERVMDRAEEVARHRGALSILTRVLILRAHFDAQHGQVRRGRRRLVEAADLMGIMGVPRSIADLLVSLPSIAAWSGATELVAAGAHESELARIEFGLGAAYRRTAAMMLAVAIGDYETAWDPRAAQDADAMWVDASLLPDVAEIALHVGAPESAELVARIHQQADANPTEWARGLAARVAAIADRTEGAEGFFLSSIDHLSRTDAPMDLARSHLVFGEWLRRHRRRADARRHLLAALAEFERHGAPAWSERARRELSTLGDAGVLADRPAFDLTPQEFAVARLAADGATNPDIAARLFLSPSTVDYHLRKVFRKVGVTSRRQLRGVELD